MPLGPEYDKQIDSQFADMKNTGGRTAARSPPRNSCSASSTTRHGRISISPAPRWARPGRHQPELGIGLRRAPARPAGGGQLRRQAMTEILFYHLQDRHSTTCFRRCSRNRSSAGGAWRCRRRRKSGSKRSMPICGPIATTFLPHGTCREGDAGEQPVLLTVKAIIPITRPSGFWSTSPLPPDAATYERIVLVFDGEDRTRWPRRACLDGWQVARTRSHILADR